MDLDPQIAEISASIDQLQAELAKSLPNATNPALRESIDRAKNMLREGQAQLADVVKQATAKADAKLAQVKEQQASIAAKLKAAEEKLAAPPAPKIPKLPAKPEFVVDPDLGLKLRQELLDRYAGSHSEIEQRAWEAGREVWDDWADWSKN